jgi:hypothetical protein
MKNLLRDDVPFKIVVLPEEVELYGREFGHKKVLALPWTSDPDDPVRKEFCQERKIELGNLIAARNWIKEHSIAGGHERHWQLDDNMPRFYRRYKTQRMYCEAGIALGLTEDFIDRYENVAIGGLNYTMFVPDGMKYPPFTINQHVYSCLLILNRVPHLFRLAYNEDTDLCLQVLADGWCTILMNAFLVMKKETMMVGGGNTAEMYKGDGRLTMARSLERHWPGVVVTRRRFGRPQHIVNSSWRKFDTPLKLKPGVDLSQFKKVDEHGMRIKEVKPVKSERIKKLVAEYRKDRKESD